MSDLLTENRNLVAAQAEDMSCCSHIDRNITHSMFLVSLIYFHSVCYIHYHACRSSLSRSES